MPRARNIKPGFFESEDPAKVGYPQRLLWIALWTLADREGRLEYRPARIKKYAFGFDPATVEEVSQWVHDLHGAGLIVLYLVGSVEVIQCVHFAKHQKPHRNDPPSEFPPPKDMKAIPGEEPLRGSNSPGIPRALGIFPGNTPLEEATPREFLGKPFVQGHTPQEFPDVERLQEASPGMNVECGMLNVEGGEGKGVLTPAPPPPQPRQLTIADSGPDPDDLFQTAAKFACEQLPAGGDVGLTAAAMRVDFQNRGPMYDWSAAAPSDHAQSGGGCFARVARGCDAGGVVGGGKITTHRRYISHVDIRWISGTCVSVIRS